LPNPLAVPETARDLTTRTRGHPERR
jgi:hypothetical protein